jgi:hypothetical protein
MSEEEQKLGGAKRKNGHKSDCSCHICENMMKKAKRGGYEEDAEKERLKKMGGSKKKNGHKPNCVCPICKNMKNAKKTVKKGGDNDSDEDNKPYDDEEGKNDLAITGGTRKRRGSKKSNGHKAGCMCPICKNMRKKGKKGGEEPDIENQLGDLEEGGIKAQSINKNTKYADSDVNPVAKVTEASEDEYDDLDSAEKGEAGVDAKVGGRKTKKRRGNGHKVNCKCPICKNMKKGRKTRRR